METAQKWEHCTVEWIWQADSLRVNMPDGREMKQRGSYKELVDTLTQLGSHGWEVVTCASGSDWLFWTLKRPVA